MMNKTIEKTLAKWETNIHIALALGKGKYKDSLVSDLFDYKQIIRLMKNKDFTKAARYAKCLDTSAREYIPNTIYKFLDKHYE